MCKPDSQANEETKREYLLDRLGGEAALKGVVYEFYGRMLEDDDLKRFFRGIDMKRLRDHQYKFMEIAFTSVPDDLDVAALIAEKHSTLFLRGLNEKHFDLVAGHLVATLEHLHVPQAQIDEVVAVVGPLRAVFEANSVAGQRKRKEALEAKTASAPSEALLDRLGGQAALKGAVYEFYGRILEDPQLAPFFEHTDMKKLRDHQYKFMEIAFTEIPKDMDVVGYLAEKHERLFERGLNATHFDLVAGHLVATLQHLHVKQDVIDDVVATVGPLRVAFDKK